MLLVETVVSNAKFHSSQEETNQSIVANVFRSINHKTEAEDLAEVAQVAEVVEDLAAEEDLTEDREKCTKLLVETVARTVRFHLNQDRINQSIVMNVFRTTKSRK